MKKFDNQIKEFEEDLKNLRNEELETLKLLKNNEHGKILSKIEEEIKLKIEIKEQKSS